MDDEKVRLDVAMPIIREFAKLIRDACQTIEVAGSVRRQAQMVKDVEFVVIAGDTLRARLDKLVATKVCEKATYGKDQTHRWGPKYRGIEFKGLRFEIFFTDEDSWGYMFWLRTGPGEANEYAMSQMAWQHAPYRFDDGALWHQGKRVSVPTEIELFRLLGMPYIAPALRSKGQYQNYMYRAKWAKAGTLTFVEVTDVINRPNQPRLF